MVSFGKTIKILLLCDLLRWRGFHAWLYISKLLVETLQIDCPWVLQFWFAGLQRIPSSLPSRPSAKQSHTTAGNFQCLWHQSIWTQQGILVTVTITSHPADCVGLNSASNRVLCLIALFLSYSAKKGSTEQWSTLSDTNQQVSDQNLAPGCWRDGCPLP